MKTAVAYYQNDNKHSAQPNRIAISIKLYLYRLFLELNYAFISKSSAFLKRFQKQIKLYLHYSKNPSLKVKTGLIQGRDNVKK